MMRGHIGVTLELQILALKAGVWWDRIVMGSSNDDAQWDTGSLL